MKGMDIFCASQAATTICLSMEGEGGGGASSSTCPFGSSGRTIDRYNPIIRDPRRLGIGKTVPSSSSQSPLDAAAAATPPGLILLNPRNNNIAVKKNSSSSSSNSKTNNIINELQKKRKKKSTAVKSSSNSGSAPADFDVDVDVDHHHHRGIFTTRTSTKSWRCTTKPGDFISPPGSSRYLLSDQPKFLNLISDFDPVLKLVPVEETSNTAQVVLKNDDDDDDDVKFSPPPSKPPPPSSSSRSPQDQVVVVLRVSLHCKGCERKMRKHISRMEGVSSFNIDFAAKKVTVVGNVTPLGVLNSISKVKSAQLWNPSISTPPPAATIKNNNSAGMMHETTPSHFHAAGTSLNLL